MTNVTKTKLQATQNCGCESECLSVSLALLLPPREDLLRPVPDDVCAEALALFSFWPKSHLARRPRAFHCHGVYQSQARPGQSQATVFTASLLGTRGAIYLCFLQVQLGLLSTRN